MEDREVGALWAKLQSDCGAGPGCSNHGDSFKLILKVLEDEYRLQLSRYSAGNQTRVSVQDDSLRRALERFGIDRAEYLKAKEQSRERGAEEK